MSCFFLHRFRPEVGLVALLCVLLNDDAAVLYLNGAWRLSIPVGSNGHRLSRLQAN